MTPTATLLLFMIFCFSHVKFRAISIYAPARFSASIAFFNSVSQYVPDDVSFFSFFVVTLTVLWIEYDMSVVPVQGVLLGTHET